MSELAERTEYFEQLTGLYRNAEAGEGHTVFLMGEAGIGKTSVVNTFLKGIPETTSILVGGCDPLSTPRPLGPLYDIATQVSPGFQSVLKNEKQRHLIFSSLLEELSLRNVVIVFEDIHWADEATIDLIKFLSRRIHRFRCLFILTYRDDEIHARHALKNIFGELVPHTFTKIQLQRLSQKAVYELAKKSGNRSGNELYELTGGNPFYVTEILANISSNIPDRVKDSILTTFNSKDENVRSFLEFLSILPARIEQEMIDRLEEEFPDAADTCLSSGIVVFRQVHYSFKHELFRITIEESLSQTHKRQLHKKVLALIAEDRFSSISLSQIVHHAQYADERKIVLETAPRTAEEASAVGAHIEASKLYAIAIRFAEREAAATKVKLYERHAYECYLTNQIPLAIKSQQKVLELWRALKSNLNEGDALRFLSRLWWYGGNRANAVLFADEAIQILENGFPTRERTMAYSNLSQLHMLADNKVNALLWGHRAVELATRMNDKEIICHGLNNIGSVLMRFSDSEKEGEDILRQSLKIALDESFHEHVARGYTNLSFCLVLSRRYREAEAVFAEGIRYCEDRDLSSWVYYMQSERIKLLLDTGKWDEAETGSLALIDYENHPAMMKIAALTVLARIRTRKGDFDKARKLVAEARSLASLTGESQRIVQVLVAQLELCWIANDPLPEDEISNALDNIFPEKEHSYHYFMLTQWMYRAGMITSTYHDWRAEDGSYDKALQLFEGNEDDQRTALRILDSLGASATVDKLKSVMKEQGIRNIPRGLRESTKSNPFQLTNRQLAVLNLLSEDLQNAEIADRLFVSVKTVDHHISAILEKLNVNSRSRAVSKARGLGLLPK